MAGQNLDQNAEAMCQAPAGKLLHCTAAQAIAVKRAQDLVLQTTGCCQLAGCLALAGHLQPSVMCHAIQGKGINAHGLLHANDQLRMRRHPFQPSLARPKNFHALHGP